jgi:cellulose synthase/poly-beta-1,6-N-acetylglucosamine synthase-like glycosyltransferase
VVVPFRGDADERAELIRRMQRIHLGESDTLRIVDNGPETPPELGREPVLMHAPERQTSYFARNRGAEAGSNEWLVFLDADVLPVDDLLDRYFDPPPGERVGVIGGGMRDEPEGDTLASRYAALTQAMAHENTLRNLGDEFAYAQTANAAVRRAAFDEVGGFDEDVRSAGDADLCFRIRQAGWGLEVRPAAKVVHRNRRTLRAMARQRARHGAGAAWLSRRYPGVITTRLGLGSPWWTVRTLVGALAARDRDRITLAVGDVVAHWAFGVGRFTSNDPR